MLGYPARSKGLRVISLCVEHVPAGKPVLPYEGSSAFTRRSQQQNQTYYVSASKHIFRFHTAIVARSVYSLTLHIIENVEWKQKSYFAGDFLEKRVWHCPEYKHYNLS